MKLRFTRSIVPNLLTLANVFCGFNSIVSASQGNFVLACKFILLGAIFDMFDGLTARLIKAASEFGIELDSLCDAVTFGIAPSFILYQIYFKDIPDYGVLIASLPALAGIVRLARFNVQNATLEDKKYFTGLPIPTAALTIASYIVFYQLNSDISTSLKPYLIYAVTLITSATMVSKIKYENLPRPSLRNIKENPIFFGGTILAILLSIVSKGFLILPCLMIFITFGFIRFTIKWFKEKIEPEYDIDQ